MRAGGCTVQQTLTAEAAGVVKHAVALARQRGHAQVTPLHVAATLLAPGASLLRRACLKSHPHSTSHPLQCRALELCFKVALNRLPTTAGPLVQGQPSLSNALVAALKRAQAHQRRGCLEQQQQPLLAVKVEMEQLIISILDDPSVSRVMREAGFSSTFVKNNLEEAVSSLTFPCSSSSSFDHPNNDFSVSVSVSRSVPKIRGLMTDPAEVGNGMLYSSSNNNNNSFINSSARINLLENPAVKSLRGGSDGLRNEDVESVMQVLLGKKTRRNTVIVGDCLLTRESVIREIMIRIERGEVPDPLRAVQFLTPQFLGFALRLLSREQVEQKIADLRRAVHNCLGLGPVIIYAGDLKWAVDVREDQHQQNDDGGNHISNDFSSITRNGTHNYCPVEHISMELGRILSSHGENPKLWVMATASYQTYMRCQMRQPSLETLWGLQAVPVPSGGLTLTLQASSTSQAESKTNGKGGDVSVPFPQNLNWPTPPSRALNPPDELADKLSCCLECCENFEAEAEFLRDQEQRLASSDRNLPLWLQQCRNANVSNDIDVAAQVESKLKELRKKWNQTCRSKHSNNFDPLHLQRPTFEPPQHSPGLVSGVRPPWWCTPQSHGASRNHGWSMVSSPSPSNTPLPLSWSHRQFPWGTPESVRDSSMEHTVSVPDSTKFDVKTTLALGFAHTKASNEDVIPSTQLARTSSIRSPDVGNDPRHSDPEGLKGFWERLAERVPWQSEANVQALATTVLHLRSGMVRRASSMNVKGDVWLLSLGPDRMGKRKMAQALAEIVFGSKDKLVCLGSPWSHGGTGTHEDIVDASLRGKTYLDRFTHAIGVNPHCVVMVEEIDKADGVLKSATVKAMERGKIMDSNGREVSMSDAIVFMTSSVGANFFGNPRSVKGVHFDEEGLSKAIAGPYCGFKLVVREQERQQTHHPFKRRAEWDLMQDEGMEKRKRKSPPLDLNVGADEGIGEAKEAETDQDAGSMTGNSDMTQETGLQTDALNDKILCSAQDFFSHQFLNSLDKCIVFRPFDFAELAESLLDRLQSSYGRASNGRGSLEVETSVLERMVSYCWQFAPAGRQTFEKWVEEIFEAGLARVLSMHTLTTQSTVKLSLAEAGNGNGNGNGDCFFNNSSLPARVEVDPNDLTRTISYNRESRSV